MQDTPTKTDGSIKARRALAPDLDNTPKLDWFWYARLDNHLTNDTDASVVRHQSIYTLRNIATIISFGCLLLIYFVVGMK